MSEPGSVRCSLDQPRDIRQDNVLSVTADNTEIRCQCSKMIIPDFGLRTCHNTEDGTLSDIRISDQPDIRNRLQFHTQCPDGCFDAGFGEIRRLTGGSRKMLVSPASFSAFQEYFFHPGFIHVSQDLSCLIIPDHSPDRHLDDKVLTVLSVAQVPCPVRSVLGSIFAPVPEIQQGMAVLVGEEDDISPFSAVPAVRSAVHDILFPVEGCTPVTAVPGLCGNPHLIHKITHCSPLFLFSSAVSAAVRESVRRGQ